MKTELSKTIGVIFCFTILFTTHTEVRAQYCTVSASDLDDDWISNFTFSNINHDSGQSLYSDFTDVIGIVETGVSYPVAASINYNGAWNQFLTVFIDFNHDEDFDDAGERFDIGNCVGPASCVISGEITIPVDALPGITRIRVIENYNGYVLNACTSNLFMEIEDYTLLIDGDCTPPHFTFDVVDNCELYTYDVQTTLNDFLGNPSISIYLNRSDIGDAGSITFEDFEVGQTLDVITDVPFGVTVSASIEGFDPLCTLNKTWNEDAQCPPVNNECNTATVLNCWNEDPIEGSTINASPSPAGIAFCNGLVSSGAPAVWYKYTATGYTSLLTSVTSDNFNVQHIVYTGGCGGLQCIGASNDAPISWFAYAGQSFYIMVTGSGLEAAGDFELTFECVNFPACGYPSYNSIMVDENGDEIIGDCFEAGGTYRVELTIGTGGDFDSYLVFVGDSSKVMYPPETHVFGTFNNGTNTNIVAYPMLSPEFCAFYGIIESELCPPVNDLACEAIPLACDDYVVGNNLGASVELGCNGFSRRTVWYTYTAPSNGSVYLSTCNPETNFDTDINMYTGTCEDGLVCFPGWGDGGYIDGITSCGVQSWAAEGSFDIETGVTYYIAVSGFYANGGNNPSEGNFGLSLTCTFDESVTIDGTVNWNALCGDRALTVDLYEPDTDVLAGSFTGMVSADGTFSIPDLMVGTFDIIVKVEGYLAVGLANTELAIGSNVLDAGNIIAGDLNGDNGINILDISAFVAGFNSSIGDANFNPLADVNCDGGVNILDVSYFSTGFNQSGASAPL